MEGTKALRRASGVNVCQSGRQLSNQILPRVQSLGGVSLVVGPDLGVGSRAGSCGRVGLG